MEEELLVLERSLEDEEMQAQDYVRMKRCYPLEVQKLSDMVDAACDALEYEGSLMYAKVVERTQVERMAERIAKQNEVSYPLILTLLCNEMYVRRCRKCRRDRMFCK